MMKSNFIKIGNQVQDIFFVRGQLVITRLLISSDFTDYQSWVSVYLKDLDPQINGCFDTEDTRFVL